MAARRTGRIPAELMAGHVLTITEGGDWPLRCAAMEAILRRCKFGDRDGLVVTSAPAGSVFGSYVTGRTATSGQAAPRRQTSANKRARNAEPRPYRTVLTRLDPLEGNCDCPDYLRGSLGLCKHLICVLDVVHTARGPQLRAAPPSSPGRHATLSWDPVRSLRGAGERLLGLRWTDGAGGGRAAARRAAEDRAGRSARRQAAKVTAGAAHLPPRMSEGADRCRGATGCTCGAARTPRQRLQTSPGPSLIPPRFGGGRSGRETSVRQSTRWATAMRGRPRGMARLGGA
jgi:hypothetical protein